MKTFWKFCLLGFCMSFYPFELIFRPGRLTLFDIYSYAVLKEELIRAEGTTWGDILRLNQLVGRTVDRWITDA